MRKFTREELRLVVSMHKRWEGMLDRCNLSSTKNYAAYGGRGIKVFSEWQRNGTSEGFENFFEYVSTLEHFGEKGYSLDRINVDGNYEPGNLRWATAKVQGNNRRTNHYVEDLDGSIISLGMAAEKYGLKEDSIYQRFKEGLRSEALFRPARKAITVDGKTLRQWSEITGISHNLLLIRYNKGYRGEELFKPVNKRMSKIAKERCRQAQRDSKGRLISSNGLSAMQWRTARISPRFIFSQPAYTA